MIKSALVAFLRASALSSGKGRVVVLSWPLHAAVALLVVTGLPRANVTSMFVPANCLMPFRMEIGCDAEPW